MDITMEEIIDWKLFDRMQQCTLAQMKLKQNENSTRRAKEKRKEKKEMNAEINY